MPNEKRLKKAFDSLRRLYAKIPDTKGCMENICSGKCCDAWCCRLQNPQVLDCEFIYLWDHIQKTWTYAEILDLLELCFRSYFSSAFNKSCVFWDKETKLCRIHTHRPFNCYIYGITPEDEIQPRIDLLRESNKKDPFAQIKDQCKLVSTANGVKVTTVMTNAWWKELKGIEVELGVKKRNIHDGYGGSYRSYHDHILLRLLPEDRMGEITLLRVNATTEEIESFIIGYMDAVRRNLKQRVRDLNDTGNESGGAETSKDTTD